MIFRATACVFVEVDDESFALVSLEQPSTKAHVVTSLDLHVLGVAALFGRMPPTRWVLRRRQRSIGISAWFGWYAGYRVFCSVDVEEEDDDEHDAEGDQGTFEAEEVVEEEQKKTSDP